MTSSDGITWTARSAPEQNVWISVTYGNGLFVAVSADGINRIMTSLDGITWTARSAAEQNSWVSVTYGNGLFVAVSINGTNRIMISSDGISWTAHSAAESNEWRSVTYGNGLFVAVSSSGTNNVMTSSDGIVWSSHSASNSSSWWEVTYGNGLFVAVSNVFGTYRGMTSSNGINWTGHNAFGTNDFYSVTYGNGLFVAVTSNSVIISKDGISWSFHPASENNTWQSITYGNGLFVAVSSDGTNRVMTSEYLICINNYNTSIGYNAGINTCVSNTISIGPNTYLDVSGSGIIKFSQTENTHYPINNHLWFGDPDNGWINICAGDISGSNLYVSDISANNITSMSLYTGDISGSNLYVSDISANNITSMSLHTDDIFSNTIKIGNKINVDTNGDFNIYNLDIRNYLIACTLYNHTITLVAMTASLVHLKIGYYNLAAAVEFNDWADQIQVMPGFKIIAWNSQPTLYTSGDLSGTPIDVSGDIKIENISPYPISIRLDLSGTNGIFIASGQPSYNTSLNIHTFASSTTNQNHKIIFYFPRTTLANAISAIYIQKCDKLTGQT
jgi:hypothetical protein